MDLSDSYRILQSIVYDMANSPDGISTGEIVQAYGISRRLVPKYIDILESAGIPIYVDRKRYYLDEGYFAAFTLTADESEFLYLILERSLIQHSSRWRTLRGLLRKLSNKMIAPLSDYLNARIDPDAGERPADLYFRLLAKAKRERREAWISYHALNRPHPSQWRIRPLRFTGNIWSDGLYVVCYGARDNGVFLPLTLKLDRILHVSLSDQHFGLEDMARSSSSWGHAWSVWNSEREPVRVLLRFEQRHYDRLLETIWHPSQQIHVDNDGLVYYAVEVSEPDEMVPWIRSWGSGVIVEEPESLRQRIIHSLKRQVRAYGIADIAPNEKSISLHRLWAKYDRSTSNDHPLVYHLLDVAAVAWQMWDRVLSQGQREWVTSLLATDEIAARSQVAWLAGLHDIGKATPTFQKKAPPIYSALIDDGINDEGSFDDPHGLLSAVILRRLLVDEGIDKRTAYSLALVIGGHHGTWINENEAQNARGAAGKEQWRQMQHDLFNLLKDVLDVQTIAAPGQRTQLHVFATFMSGFVSICDWVGSNEAFFPYEMTQLDPKEYFERALAQAETALNQTGWLQYPQPTDPASFEMIFPFKPNQMQQYIMDICDVTAAKPRLILLEYLTGGGKTEIALYLADLMVNLLGRNGLYVAMPTQATSNQMFDRVTQYLEMRYPHQPINTQLIHAQADQHPLYQWDRPNANRDGNESGPTAEAWFQNRRRALLAPYAVGTIDQAMLSVLQTRHHFVRQYGLSNKTVIFDEIHAYDTYMNKIIERLLVWLDALNSPVILLSATLPRPARERLLEQVGVSPDEMPEAPYPRLTIVNYDRSVQIHVLPAPPTRNLQLYHLESHIDLSEWLTPIYEYGGCIAIICNTVDEAIAVARDLRASPEIDASEVLLFHARFPPAWRQTIEQTVLSNFGKAGERPKRMILVATQIIEQSLDLDFDLMITRTAPVDLLIQRAGRLHRHEWRTRPEHLQQPTLVIRAPDQTNGIPDFGVDAVIYEKYILLQTWLHIHDCMALRLPDDIDSLIDAVYNERPPAASSNEPLADMLTTAFEEMTSGENGKTFKGARYRIGEPSDPYLIGSTGYDMPDDDRNIVTRDIRPSIDIICLRSSTEDARLPTLTDRMPTRDEVAHLLQFRVSINKLAARIALENLPLHSHWDRIPQLRYARPVVFNEDEYLIPGSSTVLRLTPEYGLEIMEEEL